VLVDVALGRVLLKINSKVNNLHISELSLSEKNTAKALKPILAYTEEDLKSSKYISCSL
jgi:hypothetical protein